MLVFLRVFLLHHGMPTPWQQTCATTRHRAPLSAHHACAEDRNVKRPHRPSIGGDIWWDRWQACGRIWVWRSCDVCAQLILLTKIWQNAIDHGVRRCHTAAMGPRARQQSTQQSTYILRDRAASLTAYDLLWFGRERKLSLFFVFLRRNQYESFRRWRFALGLFFSQRLWYFFTCYSHESRNTKQTLYLRHRKNELRKNKKGHACSQRAQLISVTPHELRGQKLAEI